MDPPQDPQLHAARRAGRQAAAPGRGAHGAVPRGLRPRLPEHEAGDARPHRRARVRIGACVSAVHAAVQRQTRRRRRLLPGSRRRLLHHAEHRGRRARLSDDLPRVRPPARGQLAGRRAGVVQRGTGGVLQHLPVVRRTRGIARPRQARAHPRPARALHPAHRAAGRRLPLAALQRRRAPRHLLCRVVGAGALPAAGQPAAQGPARDLPAAVRRRRSAGRRIPRRLRRERSRAREGASALREAIALPVDPRPLRRQGGDRQGLDRRSAERGRRTGRVRESAVRAAPAAGRRGPRRSRARADARPRARPGGAGAGPRLAGTGGRRGDADRGRRQGGRRQRLSAGLLPRRACSCVARGSTASRSPRTRRDRRSCSWSRSSPSSRRWRTRTVSPPTPR